ncbi:EAL domain-containing protein [Thalassotalea sp. LPB0316]|uniref:EAL domain-containing protein n=1 Tax=Thalassotalea sp. LPB0316 TaxID=2769490 RepID=UPI001868BCA9|nr:EAL domain-containing protein [Thalassotalea sp. LPB0316]QOL26430.1 EAL domain-containing protein [Thalassotalea sp. LPB0316]
MKLVGQFFLLYCLLFGAQPSASVHHSAIHIGLEEGLRQGTVEHVFQDNRGFVWALNENGIDIYDGYRFRPLQGPDNIFADGYPVDVIQDNNSNIWIAFQGEGLFFYDPINNTQQNVLSADTGQNAYIVELAIADSGELLVLTSKALFTVDVNSKQVSELTKFDELINEEHALYSMITAGSMVFFGTRSGLFVYDLNKHQLKPLPKLLAKLSEDDGEHVLANKVYDLAIDEQNTLYLGTFRGLYSAKVDELLSHSEQQTGTFRYHQIDEETSTWSLHLNGQTLFVSDERGLFSFDIKTQVYQFIAAANHLAPEVSDERIINVSSDHLGRLWLSTSSRGLLILNQENDAVRNSYHQKHQISGLPSTEVWAFAQSPSQPEELWIGTSYGLAKENLRTGNIQHYFLDLANTFQFDENHIYNLQFISDDDLLVLSARNSYLLNISSGYRYFIPPDSPIGKVLNGDIYAISYDDAGMAWLTTSEQVYYVDFNQFTIVRKYSFSEPELANNLVNVLQRVDENRYLLTSNQALYLFDKTTGAVKKVFDNPYVSQNEALPFIKSYLDDAGQLWLSVSSKGLLVLNSETFEVIETINNDTHGIDNNVYGLVPDEQGDIWFSSHDGIYVVDAKTKTLRHFDRFDGLVGNEFNWGAALKLHNNHMAFGSTAGVSILDPKKLKDKAASRNKYPIQVSEFDVLSSSLSSALYTANQSTIPLSYDDIGIRIAFTDFDFVNVGDQKFLFELQGPEPVVFPATQDNFIVFPRLASGLHRLKVQTIPPDTGVPSEPFYVNFKVSYAPWKSPIAYLIYSLVAIITISYILYRRHLRQIALLAAHEEVKYRENRLQLALKGSNSDVWDWQASDDLLFSKRINQELGYKYAESAYQFSQHIDLIHPQDKGEFLSAWQKFLQRADLEENFSCTYRLKSDSGQWLWFKDLGKIVALDSQGKPTRVTGSYTNITETRAEEERAQYYGAAFAQTKDWVVIINHDLSKITANKAIRDVFGWQAEDLPMSTFAKTLPLSKRQFYVDLIQSLKAGESWRGDELVTLDNGKEYHVLINITVGESHLDKQAHYVCLITDITAQKNAEQELRYMANYDHLTGLPNRTLLLDRIEHAMTVVQRHNSEMALLFIDLDRFKQVNDSLGHDYGDLLLKVVTERLKFALRSEDTIARLGGDEFVVLIENYTAVKDVARIAQSLIDSLAQPFTLVEHIVTIGASIGIAIYPENAEDSAELLRSADIAMYHAKQNGRNHFQFFTNQMNEQVAERVRQEARLKLAVEENKFVNHYQPIIDASGSQTVGVELLLRWPSQDGLISPAIFIPMAEELGLISEMTIKSLNRALTDLARWRQVHSQLYLSLNVSAVHFHDQSLIKQISQLLSQHQLPPSALKIEVTESALIKEPEKATQTMVALTDFGIELALDDFGTGYSSLSYLKQLPLDILKVDRSFIDGIGKDKTDQAIVDATLVLANSLNMRCIAEGVETQDQLDYLRSKGCQFFQGYFFCKPMAASDIDIRVSKEAKLVSS